MNGAAPGTPTTVTAARYCTADDPNPGLNNPIPIPSTGENNSYWKSHFLEITVAPSVQIDNIRWYTDGTLDWGTDVRVIVGVKPIGDNGCPIANYEQATGVEGTSGNHILDATNGHGYYRGNQQIGFAWSYNAGTDVWYDETSDINNATVDDVYAPPFPTGATGDAIYFGANFPFSKLTINVSTAGSYTDITLAWEYWNGTAWTALSGLTDGTSGFTVSGTNDVTYTLPTDWAKTTVNGQEFYWIRCVATYGTSPSVTAQPLIAQAWMTMAEKNAFDFTSTEKLLVDSSAYSAVGDQTKMVITQCIVGTGASSGEKPDETYTFVYDEI